MRDFQAVQRYAVALFELARLNKKQDAIDEDFLTVRKLVDQHHEIGHLLSNSTIAMAEKEDFIDKVLPSGISRTLANFIKVLVKKKRFGELGGIQEEYHRLYERAKGMKEVWVTSAAALSPDVSRKLERALKKKLNAEVRMMAEVKPSILGGLIIRFEGREINASFKSRLEEIRQKLLAR